MKKTIMTILLIILALFAALAITFMMDRDGFWVRTVGKADMGQTDFQTLMPAPKPNEALACPSKAIADFCPNRKPDIETGIYDISADALVEKILEAASELPLVGHVDDASQPLKLRFVRKTPIMRYPDTFSIEIIELAPNRSTLAIHGRALVGQSDMGNNLRLTKEILNALQEFEMSP
jgi:uncharacterized protein (DUF1499 family)